jgi:hypothetical protein
MGLLSFWGGFICCSVFLYGKCLFFCCNGGKLFIKQPIPGVFLVCVSLVMFFNEAYKSPTIY